jgi:hypothetical protein
MPQNLVTVINYFHSDTREEAAFWRHLITKDIRKVMAPCFNIDSKYIEMKHTKYILERMLIVFAAVNSLENTWSRNSHGRFKGLLHAKQHINQILAYGFIVFD